MVSQTDYQKQVVGWACSVIRKRGWHFEYSAKDQCWDVQTPHGWQTAHTAAQLARIAEMKC